MGVKERVAHIQPKNVERMAQLVTVLNAIIEGSGGNASVVYLSALYGDDDVWTIRQEIQNLFALLYPSLKKPLNA